VRPRGITPIGEKLEELLLEYVSALEDAKDTDVARFKAIKPVNYIVITDGVPSQFYPFPQLGINSSCCL
jgi:hypothetical protein